MPITDSWFHLVVNEKERNEAVSFSSPHPANNHLFKAPLSAGENSSEAGLFHNRCPSVRLQIKHLGSVMSSAWLLFAAMEAFNKKGEKKKTLQFYFHFKMPMASLCLTRDRMTACSLSLPLSLITYTLQVMSNLISSEFCPVFPLMVSKASDSEVHSNEPDGGGQAKILL